MEYIEVDIRLKEVNTYSEILIARLNEIEFESFYEYDYGLKGYVHDCIVSNATDADITSNVSRDRITRLLQHLVI